MRIVPAGLDLVLVLLFSIMGRASHAQSLTVGGVLETAWPFLVACVFGWMVVTLLGDEGFGVRAAGIIWLVTVVAGLGLRVLFGGGAALPFVLVTIGVLAALLWGWRLLAALVTKVRQSRSAASAA